MGRYRKLFQSEWYKFLHSQAAYIHLFVPLLGMLVFLAYYRISIWSEAEKVETYLQVLAMTFPVLIAVILTIVSENERTAGSFYNLFCAPCKKSLVHLEKLIIILWAGVMASFVAVVGFGILFGFMGNRGFSTEFYMSVAVLLFAGNIPLYILQYMISFSFPKGAGMGFGIVGSLLSVLFLTGLGDRIWYYLPWGISNRLCSLFVLGEVSDIPFLEWIGVKKGLLYIVAASVIGILVFLLWSRNWEAPAWEAE